MLFAFVRLALAVAILVAGPAFGIRRARAASRRLGAAGAVGGAAGGALVAVLLLGWAMAQRIRWTGTAYPAAVLAAPTSVVLAPAALAVPSLGSFAADEALASAVVLLALPLNWAVIGWAAGRRAARADAGDPTGAAGASGGGAPAA
jgi:hypothetical protein